MNKAYKHTPGPWTLYGPIGTGHLRGEEPWFWIGADTTLHLRVQACPDGFIHGENEANARLIAEAPALLQCVEELLAVVHDRERDDATAAAVNTAESLIARVRGDA